MLVSTATPDDAAEVANIYNYYIANSHATFELEKVDPSEMSKRIDQGLGAGYPFVVCRSDEKVLGYAYSHRYRVRPAYSHSAEVSIYLRPGSEGQSIGTCLYDRLLNELGNGDFHSVIAGIALPNDASVRLHEKFGFVKVAHFHEVGRKFGCWIDVGYWQKILQNDVSPAATLENFF
jgi:L-amino acid N-acyltransferase YncA